MAANDTDSLFPNFRQIVQAVVSDQQFQAMAKYLSRDNPEDDDVQIDIACTVLGALLEYLGLLAIAREREQAEAFLLSRAGWKTIDTAPRDGTRILLFGRVLPPNVDAGEATTVIAYWTGHNGGGWVWHGALSTEFTHWQALPEAPR
ncbi:MAG: hypothetical protein KDJ90_06630 [Nitratireductor sp.]|nr:hypothetical protein [Nitratireductor sp.]